MSARPQVRAKQQKNRSRLQSLGVVEMILKLERAAILSADTAPMPLLSVNFGDRLDRFWLRCVI